ncbi:MAG TPA: J domain-containing protein [Marmoricola sp.]|nr:J domain-containing protein [Marmoricola sp.]
MASSPSWYDILGVRRDATPAEIKAAWREATDKFEPGSGSTHFRLFNEAADVLLDPERRAAYDAELGAHEATGPQVAPDAAAAPAPAAPASTPVLPAVAAGGAEPPARPAPAGWVRLVVLVLLPVLALAAIAVAGYYGYHAHRDSQIEDARTEAPAAAERALESVLAYDYRHLGADERRAARFLTPRYKHQKHFAATWRLLGKGKDGKPGPAVTTRTVVTAHAVGSAVVDAAPDLARVLVFLNQTSEKAGKDPVVFQNRVVVTMVRSGNTWLVDDLKSY